MLTLTKKTDYALIALGYLAERREQTVSAREIADAFHMPAALVMNVMKTLHHAGMLSSTRGTKGGYRLMSGLDKFTMHDLIEVLEGPVKLAECVIIENEQRNCGKAHCKVGNGCPIQAPIQALHGKLVKFLKGVNLSEVFAAAQKPEPAGAR